MLWYDQYRPSTIRLLVFAAKILCIATLHVHAPTCYELCRTNCKALYSVHFFSNVIPNLVTSGRSRLARIGILFKKETRANRSLGAHTQIDGISLKETESIYTRKNTDLNVMPCLCVRSYIHHHHQRRSCYSCLCIYLSFSLGQ